MGFYTQIEDSAFLIPATKLDAALVALKDLNTNPQYADKKRSGSYQHPSFAWIDANFHEHVESAGDVFGLLGFETEENPEGLTVTGYDGKTGNEDLFFGAVAHLVQPGSFIHFRGEDGSHWRYDFDGERMVERQGQLIFE